MASSGGPADLQHPEGSGRPEGPDRVEGSGRIEASGTRQVLALHAEQVAVSRRVRKTQVRLARTTRTREALVQEDLAREQVIVERVAIGRVVEAVPAIRQEGEVTIIPVVEEVLVVERRLVLKEEVHLRRVRTTERHVQTVTLREQQAAVTRTAIAD